MKLLRKGSTGDDVKQLQKLLRLKTDGIFGPNTEKAVVRYQMSNDLKVDGVVGNETWTMLLNSAHSEDAIDESSDIQDQFFETGYGQKIHRYYLPKGEYIDGPVKNDYICLHHTASGPNPYKVIDYWGRDTRGRIATEFVLGGRDCATGNDEHDGVMVQCFPTGGQAWHLGRSGSGYMNRHTVGLEICSMGYLKDQKAYTGRRVADSQVALLDQPFRGYKTYHRYSEKQIQETKKWILFVAERDNIDPRVGLVQWIKKFGAYKAFEWNEDAYNGKVKGLITHTNVSRGKSDCYPDPRLVEMLLSL